MERKLKEVVSNLKENLTKSELSILLYKHSSETKTKSVYEIAEHFNITPTRVLQYESRIASKH